MHRFILGLQPTELEKLAFDDMATWSHNAIFLCCLIAAALGGFATLLMSDKPLKFRNVLAYLLWFGLAGTATSMLGFKFLGGKEEPWRVIGSSILVGMGVVKLVDLGPFFLKMLRSMIGPADEDKGSDKDE